MNIKLAAITVTLFCIIISTFAKEETPAKEENKKIEFPNTSKVQATLFCDKMDIKSFVVLLTDHLQVEFDIPEKLNGTVTLVLNKKVTTHEIWLILKNELDKNKIAYTLKDKKIILKQALPKPEKTEKKTGNEKKNAKKEERPKPPPPVFKRKTK